MKISNFSVFHLILIRFGIEADIGLKTAWNGFEIATAILWPTRPSDQNRPIVKSFNSMSYTQVGWNFEWGLILGSCSCPASALLSLCSCPAPAPLLLLPRYCACPALSPAPLLLCSFPASWSHPISAAFEGLHPHQHIMTFSAQRKPPFMVQHTRWISPTLQFHWLTNASTAINIDRISWKYIHACNS